MPIISAPSTLPRAFITMSKSTLFGIHPRSKALTTQQNLHVHRAQTGFSMIEVLISMVVLSIGFFGIISLQAVSMKMTYDAELLAQASLLVNTMAEKVRVHKQPMDIAPWQDQVRRLLPDGSGSVRHQTQVVTISVAWLESADSTVQGGRRDYTLTVWL